MDDAARRPVTWVADGAVPVAWLVRQRRTAALQLEALAPRGARHRTRRAVALRRRVLLLDAAIARREGTSRA